MSHSEVFFPHDEVAMVSSKSGLIKYGLILPKRQFTLEMDPYSFNKVNVIWHPVKTEKIMFVNSVCLSIYRFKLRF